jgi:amino acid transporter
MYPNPRIIYSIASDGLIFKCFSKILPKFKTPAVATVTAGLITGKNLFVKLKSSFIDYLILALLATLFDLDQLVEMTAIGIR